MNYTVLLLRPDYIADEFGKDTYLAHVQALNAEEAMVKGQQAAMLVDNEAADFENDFDEDLGSFLDYHVLFCVMGHLQDMSRLAE